jgi:hypothetical protein
MNDDGTFTYSGTLLGQRGLNTVSPGASNIAQKGSLDQALIG